MWLTQSDELTIRRRRSDTSNQWKHSVLLLGLAVNVTLAVVFATEHQNLKSATWWLTVTLRVTQVPVCWPVVNSYRCGTVRRLTPRLSSSSTMTGWRPVARRLTCPSGHNCGTASPRPPSNRSPSHPTDSSLAPSARLVFSPFCQGSNYWRDTRGSLFDIRFLEIICVGVWSLVISLLLSNFVAPVLFHCSLVISLLLCHFIAPWSFHCSLVISLFLSHFIGP